MELVNDSERGAPGSLVRLSLNKLIKSVAYSSQWNHIGQPDFCNWLADDSMTG